MSATATIHGVPLTTYADYTDWFRGEVFGLACEIRRHGEGWGWRLHGLGFVKDGFRCLSAEDAAKAAEAAITDIAKTIAALLKVTNG